MFHIRPAEKKQAKLRLALIGVSGSGKTLGAINIAAGMGKKFVVIDTEQSSADLYAGVTKYDVLPLDKPFTPERYIQAIQYAESQGYEIIIIDSLSHAWAGEGGVLDMQDAVTQASKSKNSYTAWKEVTPWHNKLVNALLHSPAHIIATMRVKTQYEVINDGGKAKPVKIGLSPIQREGMDYEFTVVLDIDKESHLYTSSKDRTQLFEGKHTKLTVETGVQLLNWLEDGRSIEEVEKEDIERIKFNIMQAPLAALKDEYMAAKNKYPRYAEELHKIATERKHMLENVGVSH